MPQEFHVLQCYTCKTYQVHQVKKSSKWNCKLCGEKQSIKKVFGQGSGYDCRQHVQKLNLLRGEQNDRDPVEEPVNQQNDSDPELQEELGNVASTTMQCKEPAKWSKYLAEKEGEDEENIYSEDLQDEKYTTDRNEFDGFHKQMKRSNKRKRQHELERDDGKTTYPHMYKDKSPAQSERTPSCQRQTTLHNKYNSTITSYYQGFQKSGTVHSESTKHDRTSFPQDSQQLNNMCNEQSDNSDLMSSKWSQFEERKILIEKHIKNTKSSEENCQQKSKWGKFVEEGSESVSEDSDTEDGNVYSTGHFSKSSLPFNSQDDEDNLSMATENPFTRNKASNEAEDNKKFEYSKGDNSDNNDTETKSSGIQYIRHDVKHGQNNEESEKYSPSNKGNNCVLKGHKSIMPIKDYLSFDITSKIQTAKVSNKKSLFSVEEELEDEDFNFEM